MASTIRSQSKFRQIGRSGQAGQPWSLAGVSRDLALGWPAFEGVGGFGVGGGGGAVAGIKQLDAASARAAT